MKYTKESSCTGVLVKEGKFIDEAGSALFNWLLDAMHGMCPLSLPRAEGQVQISYTSSIY